MNITLSDKQIRQIAEKTAEILLPLLLGELDEGKPMMTTEEKAKQLGISPGTLRHWVANGKIDAIKTGESKQSKLLFKG